MSELHPSTTALGAHFDEQTEIAQLAHQYYEEEGRPEGRAHEHWLRAEQAFRNRHLTSVPEASEQLESGADPATEQVMHLAQ